MKIVLLYLSLSISSVPLFAQRAKYQHPSTLEVHYSLHDFWSKRPFGPYNAMDAGVGLCFIKGISEVFDWQFDATASYSNSVPEPSVPNKSKLLLIQSSAAIRGRMFSNSRWFQPYILGGLGATSLAPAFGMFIPLGTGIEFRYKDVFLLLNGQYRLSLNNKLNSGFYYSLGIAGIVSKNKRRKIVQVPTPTTLVPAHDSDGDGIFDIDDACPLKAGLQAFNGCPDSDNDGIEDRKDKCAAIYGVVEYAGCPIPDSDGDGINDEVDMCPSIVGVLRHKGCPVPDSDKDGINDEEDSCIQVPGLRENKGCPTVRQELVQKMQQAAQNIFFETGSSKLLPKSYSVLDAVAAVLIENGELKLAIEGHTDSQGADEQNQLLSQDRANAVLQYLVFKGISGGRLQAIGYGEKRPVADNASEEGRAKNRRVELKLHIGLVVQQSN